VEGEIPLINAYCVDDITILCWPGEDEWGEPDGDYIPLPIKGYIEWKLHLVRNIAGEQVVSRGMIYIPYSADRTHKDKIKINDVEYVILDIKPGKDFSKNHLEVHLQ